MALTAEEKAEILNKKDADFKSKLKDEELAKQKAMKKEVKAVRAENELAQQDDRIRENVSDDDKAQNKKGRKYWDIVNRNAETLIEGRLEGYNDFAIAMSGLVRSALELHKALYYDPIEWSKLLPYHDARSALWQAAKDAAWNFEVEVGPHKIGPGYGPGHLIDKLDKIAMKDNELPTIRFSADFNDQGKLTTKVTKDNEEVPPKLKLDEKGEEVDVGLKSHFDTGITAWAEYHGFKMNNGVYAHMDDPTNLLTNEKFKELNKDPEESLEKFLSGRFEFHVQPSVSP